MSEAISPTAPERESQRKAASADAGPDLDVMTVAELTALIEAAEAKRREKQTEAKAGLLLEFREKAAQLGLTLESLLPMGVGSGSTPKLRKDSGDKVPVKYRGPNGEEWSGRGRSPKWVQTIEAEGRSRDEFKA